MTTRDEEAIETFMSIAGVPEATAIVKLQEHGGNLNQAINAHFAGEDGTRIREPAIAASVDDAMEVDDDFHTEVHRPPFSHLPSSGILNPLSLIDPNFTRRLISGEIDLTSREPLVSHPIEATEIQGNLNPFSLLDPSFTRRFLSGEIDISSSAPLVSHPIERAGQSGSAPAIEEVIGNVHSHGPEVEGIVTTIDDDEEAPNMRLRSGIVDAPDYSNDIEEEMIRAAIEASKNDAEIDEPLDNQSISIHDEVENLEDQPLVRQRRRRTSPREDDQLGRDIHSDEWGGISSVEHDEAVMLEAAMFGGIPEGSTYRTPFASHQFTHNGSDSSLGPYSRPAPRPPSPSLTAQRLIREQQDDEYLASLEADREKELKAKEEEEAALAEERIKEDELRRKIEDDQEIERQLAAKEASLPEEPALDDENVVTLLIRMPDGSKRGRRFLKSDKLQRLFDFIDVGRVIKPGTYRVVIPYPRRAFSDGESSLTLNELGLTSKQEALFLELI